MKISIMIQIFKIWVVKAVKTRKQGFFFLFFSFFLFPTEVSNVQWPLLTHNPMLNIHKVNNFCLHYNSPKQRQWLKKCSRDVKIKSQKSNLSKIWINRVTVHQEHSKPHLPLLWILQHEEQHSLRWFQQESNQSQKGGRRFISNDISREMKNLNMKRCFSQNQMPQNNMNEQSRWNALFHKIIQKPDLTTKNQSCVIIWCEAPTSRVAFQ